MAGERDIVTAALRTGLHTRLVGRRILHVQRLPSTMDEARLRAAAGEDEGTVVVAEEQWAARGRLGHRWVAPPGNLYCSVILRPPPQALPFLTVLATVAVARTVERATRLPVRVKWPNDVHIRGRKVAGVLVEGATDEMGQGYAILGLGVNIGLDPDRYPEIAATATSLRREMGEVVDRGLVLKLLLEELDRAYRQSVQGAPPMDEWRGLLDTVGRRVVVRWRDEVHEGVAEGVDDLGNLVLRRDDGSAVALPAGQVTSHV